MSREFEQPNRVEVRAVHLDNALRPGGLLHEIAQAALADSAELAPSDVLAILLPDQPGEPSEPRWKLIENAPGLVQSIVAERADDVLGLAAMLDMRKSESLPAEELTRIDSDDAIWLVEGGANRTSVMRRGLAIQAMQKIYGDQVNGSVLLQFGSSRPIPREVDGQPNPEYTVAEEIAEDFLPEDDSLTEFDLNVASALQDGYQADSEPVLAGDVGEVKRLRLAGRVGTPILDLINSRGPTGDLRDTFDIAQIIYGNYLRECQFVIATNGQYRPRDELLARNWASRNRIRMTAAVALGDEPGFTVVHNNTPFTTAERQPLAYLNEMVILSQLSR